MRIKALLERSLSEIRQSTTLRFYGAALAMVHVLTFYFWRHRMPQYLAADNADLSVCWPFFAQCDVSRILPESVLYIVIGAYGIASLLIAGLFVSKRKIDLAFWSLGALTIFKLALLVQDYRFMGNYHYMPFLVTLAYLLIPQKVQTIQVLIAGFYLSAGTLKLNTEWLSGAAVMRVPEWVSPYLFQLSCALVAVLELVVVWLLLSSRGAIRWTALSLFAIFHAVSWYWVGYFYPLVMACVLAIYPLSWRAGERFARPSNALSIGFLGVFILAQIAPRFSRIDPALDGRLRIASLNMFDARSECLGSIVLRYKEGVSVEWIPDLDKYGVRVHCDPIFFEAQMRAICEREGSKDEFINADAHLVAKRTTDRETTTILKARAFCPKAKGQG